MDDTLYLRGIWYLACITLKMKYLNWKEEKMVDFSASNINMMYDKGFVFTRIEKGVMQQTRSIRINLNKFEITSENRRILKKGNDISMNIFTIPYKDYSWKIGKIAKDFYDKKAGGAFSANKIKELITTEDNFNILFSYSEIGYTIAYMNENILHYCYPFYDLEKASKDMGMIMMIKAIEYAKSKNLKYVYLGSLQRPSDIYKLQFTGIEWFDGKEWKEDKEEVKMILNTSQNE